MRSAGIAAALLAAGPAWAQDVDHDAIRALVAEAMADAQARTSLVSETGGHDGRFFLQSADGQYRLTIYGFTQFRYTANWRDVGPGVDDFDGGFSIPRSRLFFEGTLPKDLAYRVRFGFNESSGDAILEHAFVTASLPDQWKLRAGQFSLALFRDDWIEAPRQLAVNASIVNVIFGQGNSQGLQVSREWEDVRIWGAFSDGLRTANTPFGGNNAEAALTGRVEWRAAGDWARFNDYTSFKGSDFAMLLGVAAHWETERPELAQLATDDLFYVTADIGIEGDGWNAFAALVYAHRNGTLADDPTITQTDDAGLIVQGGFFLTEHIEAFARFDHLFADDDYAIIDDASSYTGGLNYYVFPGSHALKITANLIYAPDSYNGTAAENNTSVGIRTADGDQWVFQWQLQVMY